MNISILIPEHRDLRIYNMISSIDYYDCPEHHVELVIVLNRPTNEVLRMIEIIKEDFFDKFVFNIVKIDICNLGLAYNEGIKHATYNNILFIDTDLICGTDSIRKVVESSKDFFVTKAKIVYKNMNRFVEKARLINTTEVEPPYIPVILIKKQIFTKFKEDYLFAVDTVWCSDAEFAYRVLNEGVSINYINAEFYHDSISIKKDLKDAIVYGFGKAIRIKRTKENWNPIKEIHDMKNNGKKHQLSFFENLYSLLWITLQQLSCGLQMCFKPFFKNSLPFEASERVNNIKIK